MLSVLGDAVVALLLIATIGYSVVLNRRLTSVRSDRDKFEVLVRTLNAASQRAEAAVAGLRQNAAELSRRLDKRVEEARALSDDLVYMIERGGGLADKLADQIRVSLDGLKPDFSLETKAEAPAEHRVEPVLRVPPQRPPREAAPPPRPQARPEPIQVEAVRAEAVRTAPVSAAVPRAEPARAEPARAQPARADARVAVPAAAAKADAEPQAGRFAATSRAERDLLRALAARRR